MPKRELPLESGFMTWALRDNSLFAYLRAAKCNDNGTQVVIQQIHENPNFACPRKDPGSSETVDKETVDKRDS
jgi:hypothetical protein